MRKAFIVLGKFTEEILKLVKENFLTAIADAERAIAYLRSEEALYFLEELATQMVRCYERGGKLIIAGNGGSLCDAMHFAEELTGFYRKERPALAALALSDPGHLSCVANDVGYERVFARGVEALGKEGDIFVALTTSGNSINLIRAAEVAKRKGLMTVGFLGRTGGALKPLCDLALVVGGFPYSDRVQEAHKAAFHMVIEEVERRLFYVSSEEQKACYALHDHEN